MVLTPIFSEALQKRNIVTRKNLSRLIDSTDYLELGMNNTAVVLTKNIFAATSSVHSALPRQTVTEIQPWEKAAIEEAAKECFKDTTTVVTPTFSEALQKRNVVTRKRLVQIIDSTDYLRMAMSNMAVTLTKNIFEEDPVLSAYPSPPLQNSTALPFQNTVVPPSVIDTVVLPSVVDSAAPLATSATKTTKTVPPLTFDCDTDAIVELLGDIDLDDLDLEDPGVTDIFIDVGAITSAKVNGEVVLYNQVIDHYDVDMILENLPDGAPTAKQSNRVIFGQTLHRLATVMYDGVITGVTIRVGRSVSGLWPIFKGLVEGKNVLLCGAPNVGKTTTLREICKYLSDRKCLCLIDSSGEVCGDTDIRGDIVGTSRVFRPEDPKQQYETLLDCVRNHSPDVIAIDELNTKEEVAVCQTIALRSIRMVASVHGNIEDLVFNPMLNKALGGSTQALVSDRVAVDGKKVVTQRTTRPIFDVVINIKRTEVGLEYWFIEDVAEDATRIMQGKPIQVRTRRIVGDEMLETVEEVLVSL
ncbi:MAG: hypothetical protein BYD32DRAFT_457186 [Podila humilis]|nr:MAG: hypothetical protein BYD32DRAFT_457186 [Podila humilis]